ncbi:Protein kinase domain [Carpediemonas membranifera]|uniref:Protein kinase domain n=1 Tax=Carpediemonas membranifera TaxID=201153 RepID=A0A8J6BY57_9EUKA|nr:Protein kinase domain [Carpediemonas membranifera]|eukprot:KAG9394161.1 Protein kinase domain [Carpediemonas membranifera]
MGAGAGRPREKYETQDDGNGPGEDPNTILMTDTAPHPPKGPKSRVKRRIEQKLGKHTSHDSSHFQCHDNYYRDDRDSREQTLLDIVNPLRRPPITRWQLASLIGQGAFGAVYLGMNQDTGSLMAVKQVVFNGEECEEVAAFEYEIGLMQNLNHRNIVKYLGFDRTETTLNIFMELVPGGSMSAFVSPKKFGPLQESLIRIYTKQILLGLKYLHDHQIIHRDIKGANILVSSNGVIKLADFGASKKLSTIATKRDDKASLKGTPYFIAPEAVTDPQHVGRQSDIWSVGCCIIEMATGKPPYYDEHENASLAAVLFKIASLKTGPDPPDYFTPEGKAFLKKCFQLDPANRPTAKALLADVWLRGVPVPEGDPEPAVVAENQAEVDLPGPAFDFTDCGVTELDESTDGSLKGSLTDTLGLTEFNPVTEPSYQVDIRVKFDAVDSPAAGPGGRPRDDSDIFGGGEKLIHNLTAELSDERWSQLREEAGT